MNDDGTGLLTIGELARATGLTVRTIRYWSDEGVLTPVTRSAGGYRLYDAQGVARLELIRTLRELGVGLDDVRQVLAGERTVAQVAATHVAALDAQISSLKVTRAVLSSVARHDSTARETTLMNKLARLSAAERQRIMAEFVTEALQGLDAVDPEVRERLRATTVDLAADPTPEEVDAWVELAEMLQDPEFRAQMRRAMELNSADGTPGETRGRSLWFAKRLVELVAPARGRGITPQSPDAEPVLRELFGDAPRADVLERMAAGFNERVARYRELIALVNRAPASPHAEDFAWVVAALRARTDS
ncbi:MerR family transcriptional regulator [Streptomyces sp. SID4946]|uniref:MerR family transcriptional regulator n=1 Tax=Streptomyces sp. LamerLS-31b TaxID=1839765 RepID=UPI00081E34D7|nr:MULTISPECIES: MerR family transcriptional regulator [unclassified Streptomyces]MYQ91444.1 MerR family transcriptional regulator [Streptomyces sp. SID4946]SCF67546.1 DNA-binding transcriptional regulator, MerR family [Streptomyces sp. DconLS]SCF72962.1 DNA-binding transcriptional regulator, MerR family [Streptomyces sp. LamerLS-31b]